MSQTLFANSLNPSLKLIVTTAGKTTYTVGESIVIQIYMENINKNNLEYHQDHWMSEPVIEITDENGGKCAEFYKVEIPSKEFRTSSSKSIVLGAGKRDRVKVLIGDIWIGEAVVDKINISPGLKGDDSQAKTETVNGIFIVFADGSGKGYLRLNNGFGKYNIQAHYNIAEGTLASDKIAFEVVEK